MTEGADIEAQGLQKIEKLNKIPVVEEKETKNKAEEIKDLENDPNVVEHVDRAKVEALVKKIGEFYSVPQRAIEQGLKSEIFIIKNKAFNRALEDEYRGDLNEEEVRERFELIGQLRAKSISEEEFDKKAAELSKKIEEKKEDPEVIHLARKHAEDTGGVSIPQENGGSIILVKENSTFDEEHIETHELFHSMSLGKKHEYKGFINRLSVGSIEYDRNLNEASTELLTLTVGYPDINIKELFNRISSGEIKTGYRQNVLKVLTMLHFTEQSQEPLTVKELAKYYFHDFEGEDDAASLLKNKFIEKIRPDLYRKVEPWLLYDLNDAEG
jgi:hypothetical protein